MPRGPWLFGNSVVVKVVLRDDWGTVFMALPCYSLIHADGPGLLDTRRKGLLGKDLPPTRESKQG